MNKKYVTIVIELNENEKFDPDKLIGPCGEKCLGGRITAMATHDVMSQLDKAEGILSLVDYDSYCDAEREWEEEEH